MLGHGLEMAYSKFQGNWFRIDAEIDEKQALYIYQNNCVLAYSELHVTHNCLFLWGSCLQTDQIIWAFLSYRPRLL